MNFYLIFVIHCDNIINTSLRCVVKPLEDEKCCIELRCSIISGRHIYDEVIFKIYDCTIFK